MSLQGFGVWRIDDLKIERVRALGLQVTVVGLQMDDFGKRGVDADDEAFAHNQHLQKKAAGLLVCS
jgi:hypothetical protein